VYSIADLAGVEPITLTSLLYPIHPIEPHPFKYQDLMHLYLSSFPIPKTYDERRTSTGIANALGAYSKKLFRLVQNTVKSGGVRVADVPRDSKRRTFCLTNQGYQRAIFLSTLPVRIKGNMLMSLEEAAKHVQEVMYLEDPLNCTK